VKGWTFLLAAALMSGVAQGAIFERYLSPDRPEDRAIMAYLELERGGKASSDDLADLGVLLLDKGFPRDAERYLDKALDLDKKNYEARYRLGLVLQREGKLHGAVRQYKKVIAQRPGYAYARFMLALAEERLGRRRDAIHDYVEAYKHAPELADSDKNPLVIDSRLQTEAELLSYKREAASETIAVTFIDPEAVQRMMSAVPPAASGESAPATAAPATAAPAQSAGPAEQPAPPAPVPTPAIEPAPATAPAPAPLPVVRRPRSGPAPRHGATPTPVPPPPTAAAE
jgi:tetratricopeptide (TPR) repeat protein